MLSLVAIHGSHSATTLWPANPSQGKGNIASSKGEMYNERADRVVEHPMALTTTNSCKESPVMAATQFIPPFDPMIDRDHFGPWLSGFTAGEGNFRLGYSANKHWSPLGYAYAKFKIGLRSDDRQALEMIQSFWQCGTIQDSHHKSKNRPNDNPQSRFVVSRTPDLHNIVVPHFQRWPLIGKKHEDFEIWRRGVEIVYRVARKPPTGTIPKWTNKDIDEFLVLFNALKVSHGFNAPPPPPPPPSPTNGHSQGELF